MAWYFLASTARLLPGCLMFSTTIRAVPLVWLESLGSRRDVGRFFAGIVTSNWLLRVEGPLIGRAQPCRISQP